MDYVVIEDPEGRYYEGSLVEQSRAAQLTARGVAVLPLSGALMKISGAGGYVKRAWGAGWPLDTLHPVMAAQVLLYVDPTCSRVHWLARLVPSEASEQRAKEGVPPQGSLRIAADSSQRSPNAARLVPQDPTLDASRLGRPDARGGWTVGGKAALSCPVPGPAGFALYGHAPGLRVLWAAVSSTEK